jgi:hypothetical protein
MVTIQTYIGRILIELFQLDILDKFVNIQFKTGRKPSIFPLLDAFSYTPPTFFLMDLFIIE